VAGGWFFSLRLYLRWRCYSKRCEEARELNDPASAFALFRSGEVSMLNGRAASVQRRQTAGVITATSQKTSFDATADAAVHFDYGY
jgi:hypothetical protein